MTTPVKEFTDLPPDIQSKILGIEADSTWAKAVQELVKRERIKLENEEKPIIGEFRRKRTGLPALIYGPYEDLGFMSLSNLEEIQGKMEELTILREHPVAMRARGMTQSHIEGITEGLKEAEEKMYLRGISESAPTHIRLVKNVKKANNIYNLIKKINTNKE